MAIRFTCQCGQELQAREEHAGRKTRCPKCGAEPIIPGAAAESVQSKEDAAPAARRRDFDEEDDRVRSKPDSPARAPHFESADEDDFSERSDRPIGTGTSGKARVSLILGLMSFGCTLLAGIPAVIAGIMSLRDIGASEGRLKGRGMAISGIVLGAIGSVLIAPALFIAILIGLLIPAVQKVREAAARTQSANNLKQIGIAMHNHNDVYQSLPPGNFKGTPRTANYGNPGLSWRVALLPFLEEDALYRQFHLDEPWDSPHNKTLLTRMPKVYAHPSADGEKTAGGFTHYRAFTGPHTLFDPTLAGGAHLATSFPDGTANTIFVVEASEPVEWTKPDDLPYGPGVPLPKLGITSDGSFNALMGDASVRKVDKKTSETTLRAAITRDGGEVLGPDW
jgi:hypothetical protein